MKQENIEFFVKEYIKKIVSYPDELDIIKEKTDDGFDLTILANYNDVGRLIGKDGKMIGAIKTVISGCKAKNGLSYKVKIESL